MRQTPSILYESQRGIDISINNLSSTITSEELHKVIRSVQVQITRDFFPIWGINANLQMYDVHRSYNQWQVVLLDDTDQASALGYHDVTAAGLPLGKIFASTSAQSQFPWSVVFSHEILEMLVDPYCELAAFNQDSTTTGQLVAYEVCDPVQDHGGGYMIGDVEVSNFVYPGWFEAAYPENQQVDFLKSLPGPLVLGSGGYISVFDVNPVTRGWTQVTAATRSLGDPMPSKTRLAMRNKPKEERILSDHDGIMKVAMNKYASINPKDPAQTYHANRKPLTRKVKL